jgi:hypothetical protein
MVVYHQLIPALRQQKMAMSQGASGNEEYQWHIVLLITVRCQMSGWIDVFSAHWSQCFIVYLCKQFEGNVY